VAWHNPFATHWLGRYPLLPTLIFTVLLLRISIGSLQNFIPTNFILVWILASLAVFVWQVVGTTRAAKRFLKDSGNMIGVYAAYFAMLSVTVMTIVQGGDALANEVMPESRKDSSYTLPVLSDKQMMRVDGNLDWEMFSAFERTLDSHPGIENVKLGSSGGYVFVARAMALLIESRELNTHVATHCYSACTLAFVAGSQRTMDKGAKLGFHRYKLESTEKPSLINVSEELEKDRRFFAERGLSSSFVENVFNAKHSELWVPDHEQLLQAGVLSNVYVAR